MIISGSDIKMSSMHSFEQKSSVKEDLRIWIDDPEQRNNTQQALSLSTTEKVSLSEKSKEMLHAKTKALNAEETIDDQTTDSKTYIIKLVIEAITGKKIGILRASDLQNPEENKTEAPEQKGAQQADTSGQQGEGWGLVYNYEATKTESEQMMFKAHGVINTADGEEIKFNIKLKMDREFSSTESVNIRMGDAAKAVDPLVINFNGAAAELTDTKFAFDLNSDGTDENISFVGSNSGILVFDKNSDGKVNNGSELFGPSTGNGFAELAAYDQDGNNWIDQNDAAYNSLNIWTKSSSGEDILRSLSEAGVGAIGLQNIQTQFNLTDAANNLNGQLAKTGVYVSEEKTVGTIQQVNLVI
ncbi:MAG: hypothetical protein LLF86_04175 [Nitrospiraceae bacterium]|nr:hypothetical protein [Nitrospiraceae bacterium]